VRRIEIDHNNVEIVFRVHLRLLRAQVRRNLTRIRKLGTIVRARVECTFAWLIHNRRLAKDWERLSATIEMWIYLAMCRLTTKRLAHATPQFSSPL
jgi:hypothetical protein